MSAGRIPLSREESESIAHSVMGYSTAPAAITMAESSESGSTSFALNEIEESADRQFLQVAVTSTYGAKSAAVYTNHLDDPSLRDAVAKSEAMAQKLSVPMEGAPDEPGPAGPVNPALWHDNSFKNLEPEGRFEVVQEAVASIKQAGLTGAGDLSTSVSTLAALTKAGHFEYGHKTLTNYSITARTPDNTGSGWAGWRGEDWSVAKPKEMAERAIDLAQRSRNPVAIEPGRYTVVMTPQAVGDLVYWIARAGLSGPSAERGAGPFAKPGGGTKIGLKVFDERISMSADPMDPDGGFLPFDYDDGEFEQFSAVTWVDHGVLKHLAYEGASAKKYNQPENANSRNMRVSSGPTSIDDMIASVQRGVYVTRFSGVRIVEYKTFLMTGVTRDGTFLIENGKMSKSVKNFRFEDSPFFFLNNLEALGPAQRVPVWARSYIMPCATVRDFAFTSLSDAV